MMQSIAHLLSYLSVLKFDESRVSREPKGSATGGQFAKGGGGGKGTTWVAEQEAARAANRQRLGLDPPQTSHAPGAIPNRTARMYNIEHRVAQRVYQENRRQRGAVPEPPVWTGPRPIDVLRGPQGDSETRRTVAAGVADAEAERDKAIAQHRYQRGESVSPGMERNMGQAGYADILNAPTGEGFKNRPRGIDLPAIPPAQAEGVQDTPELATGEIDHVVRKLSGTANATYRVDMGNGVQAMFKPEAGERWGQGFANSDITDYITNTQFSLAEREAMASEVSVGLGLGRLVPETHLREQLDVPGVTGSGGGSSNYSNSDESGGGYDEDYAREQYDEYVQNQRDRVGNGDYDGDVGEQMEANFQEAQREHAANIEKRAEELTEIWNEEVENFPDLDPTYGSESLLNQHPALPLGSLPGFDRKAPSKEVVDPLDILKAADVDVKGKLSREERDKVRAIIRAKMAEGASDLGDVDEDAAEKDLDRDNWYEEHQDTEMRLLDSAVEKNIQTFDSWRHDQGYNSGSGGGGGGETRNHDAPHPNGGSLQDWIKGEDYPNDEVSFEDKTKMAVLDYALGTMDRHGGNLMFDSPDGNTPVAIDNGYSMPSSNDATFRSEIVQDWMNNESQHDDLSEAQRQPLLDALNTTDWKALIDRHPNMSRGEREAFEDRLDTLRQALTRPDGLAEAWRDKDIYGGF